ncbi:type IV pili [Francisella sp. XLW-1]|uniref:type IV pili n=1 Tax=Francisella sp. XLW-1 TaxID=2610887 RepID=UPI00123CA054|nr:type IV pili [Francisella sp. XLW-1]
MISLLLEKRRKKAQRTVLGVEYDRCSLASVKLDRKGDSYALVSCDSDIFTSEAYFEGELTSEYVGSVIAEIIKRNKLGRFTKLGFASYNEIDVTKEEISCDKRALEIIKKEGVLFYIAEYFLKKRFPESYADIAYDYYDQLESNGTLIVYYISDNEKMKKLYNIANKAKRALSACVLDKLAISDFVSNLYLNEISKYANDSIFLGLYSDKLSIYSFSPQGELKSYESVKIFDENISDIAYVDEVIQLLLRFMDFMSLDLSESNFDSFDEVQDNNVYIYGIKQNFESIFESIKDLSQKNCKILDPFVNIDSQSFGSIEQPYRYVMSVAIAMKEAL